MKIIDKHGFDRKEWMFLHSSVPCSISICTKVYTGDSTKNIENVQNPKQKKVKFLRSQSFCREKSLVVFKFILFVCYVLVL